MSSHCCHSKPKEDEIPAINRRLMVVGGIFVGILLLSFLPLLAPLNESMLRYLAIVWWAVLLGLVFVGIIDYFVPDGFVVRLLGGQSKLKLVNAVLAGFLMSACSHGILAIAIEIYKNTAAVGAQLDFLLASGSA